MAKPEKQKRKKEQARKTARKKLKKKSVALPDFFVEPKVTDQHLARVFFVLTASFTILLSIMALSVGPNGDEDVQAKYSDDLVSFYTSFGKDTSAFQSSKGDAIRYYGGIYEIPAGVVNNVLGYNRDEPAYYRVRHLIIALFGGVAMLFTGLFTRLISNWKVAILAVILLFLSPRFLGHSMMNPKDIPFAAGYIMSLYYIAKLILELPKINKATVIWLAVGIGISIGARIGGILLVFYLGLALLAYILLRVGLKNFFTDRKLLFHYTKIAILPSFGGLFIGLVFWPYGLINPIKHIPEAFGAFSDFETLIKVLFKGEMIWSQDVPLQYTLTWMYKTIPPAVLLGTILIFFRFRSFYQKEFQPFTILLGLLGFLFPIIFILLNESALYDGWRHLLFTYPCLVAISGAAWFSLYSTLKKKSLQYLVVSILALACVDPLAFMIRNPNFHHVYFNPLNGGVQGALGNYELDYWGTSVKQAAQWLAKNELENSSFDEPVVVATNFSYGAKIYLEERLGANVNVIYQRYRNRDSREYDYAIWVNRFIDGSYLRNGHWPTSKTIHQIQLNGKIPIAIIEKEDSEHLAYQCAQAVNQRDWDSAIDLCSKELEKYPDNEVAWLNLGLAHLSKNDYAAAKPALDKGLSITPEGMNALNFMGIYYLNTNNIDMALSTFEDAVRYHDRNTTGYYYKAFILANQQQLSEALQAIQECITANPQFANCYDLGARIHEQLGDTRSAQAFRNALSQIRGN